MAKIPFRFDQVGSLLRPKALKEAREKFKNGEITKAELTQVEDTEIIKVIEKQKKVGLKAVTDGEFRRRWWHLDFIAGLNGITVYDFTTTAFGVTTEAQGTYVSDKLSFDKNHPFLEHFKFTNVHAGEAIAKQTIPGPNMIFLDSFILSKQYNENPVYQTVEEFEKDLIHTYQEAIQAFYDAGCRYLQLDDTSWGGLFDERFRGMITQNGYDPDELIQKFGDITEAVLSKKPEDLAVTFHFCKGNFQSHWLYNGSYDKIAKRLLGISQFNGFFLEFDDERSGSFEPMANIGEQYLVLGLITTKTPKLEDKEQLKLRIKEATQYVPLNQLCLSPQCGFSSTHEGNKVTEEDQWAKLALVIEVAKEVWEDA
ncbi:MULTISPECIES: 5-methyltetrahydropteroyltriglutamate--homocysteine S-methyltransferase [Enterococcus]|uniref:5-methyltetrahydropteroyltriglutamate-homocysteine methyltransferase n=1 Tax=Candidatus Enterococcus ferrettii TaxID=2815324 RepID=A0ABV0ER68_9ENTE|nr:5-methyltetrahydropteroyltriglutamate--homocysteine S-methyltransferase [Enterococcus sp. 665A]MBO1339843.1 5-methyltetrahydropteroyltriglutamate--homocysteine S-methyltransferase [Enterococcus sp. 665A]